MPKYPTNKGPEAEKIGTKVWYGQVKFRLRVQDKGKGPAHMCRGTWETGTESEPILLRSAVGKTHDLRSDL